LFTRACEVCADTHSSCASVNAKKGYDTDNYKPVSPSQLSFVEEFQAGILKLIAALPAGTGVFAPTCLVHCLSGQSAFTTLIADNLSLNSALSAWYFNGEPMMAVSPCIGWDCINSCGVDLQTSLPCNIGTQQCSQLQLASDRGATTSTDTSGRDTSNVAAEMAAVQAEKALPAGSPAAPRASSTLVQDSEASLSAAQQSTLTRVLARPTSAAATASDVAAPASMTARAASARKTQTQDMLLVGVVGAALVAAAAYAALRSRAPPPRRVVGNVDTINRRTSL
jgi:hypothetical protein